MGLVNDGHNFPDGFSTHAPRLPRYNALRSPRMKTTPSLIVVLAAWRRNLPMSL